MFGPIWYLVPIEYSGTDSSREANLVQHPEDEDHVNPGKKAPLVD